MTEIVAGLFHAVPLSILTEPAKLCYLLDRLVEHETEWSDFQKGRREIANAALAQHYDANGRTVIFEVWRLDGTEPELVGLVAFTNVLPHVGAEMHPVFFDGRLRNANGKRELLLRLMEWAFEALGVHRVTMDIPLTSFALVDFVRKKLGFRFEGEGRSIEVRRAVPGSGHHRQVFRLVTVTPTAEEADIGSRRYQAFFKNGKWQDVLLLSITAAEFAEYIREHARWVSSLTDPTPSRPSPKTLPDSEVASSAPSATAAGTPASSASSPASPKATAEETP